MLPTQFSARRKVSSDVLCHLNVAKAKRGTKTCKRVGKGRPVPGAPRSCSCSSPVRANNCVRRMYSDVRGLPSDICWRIKGEKEARTTNHGTRNNPCDQTELGLGVEEAKYRYLRSSIVHDAHLSGKKTHSPTSIFRNSNRSKPLKEDLLCDVILVC